MEPTENDIQQLIDDNNASALHKILTDTPQVTSRVSSVIKEYDHLPTDFLIDLVIVIKPSYLRNDVVERLGKSGDLRAVTPLINILEKENTSTQRIYHRSIAGALGQLKDERAVDILITILQKNEDQWLIKAAITALGQIKGNYAINQLSLLLQSAENDQQRRNMAHALGTIGDVGCIDVLTIALLNEQSHIVRSAAALALGQIGTEDVISALSTALQSEQDKYTSIDIARALGITRHHRAIKPLSHNMINTRGKDWYARYISALALGLIPDLEAIQVLMIYITDEDKRIASAAIEGLGIMASNRVDATIEDFMGHGKSFLDKKRDVRMEDVLAVPQAIRWGVVYVLQMCLSNEYWEIRRDSIVELGYLGEESIPLLRSLLHDEHEEVRKSTAEGLGRIRNDETLQILSDSLFDPLLWDVVIKPLQEFKQAAFETWIKALRSDNPWIRKAAIDALGELKDSRAIEPIRSLLDDSHQQVQDVARQVLGKLDTSYIVPETTYIPTPDFTPRVVYWGQNPWNSVIGSDAISFVHYDNGLTLFAHKDSPSGYYAVELSDSEQQQLLNSIPFDELLDSQVYRLWNGTDAPRHSYLIWKEGAFKQVTIEGRLTEDADVPESVHQLDRAIMSFHHENSYVWLPDKIEVIVWAWRYAVPDGNIWDSDLPDLYHQDTRFRGSVYSLYVDSAHFDYIQSVCRDGAPLMMNGRKWASKYRFPVPSESYISQHKRYLMSSFIRQL